MVKPKSRSRTEMSESELLGYLKNFCPNDGRIPILEKKLSKPKEKEKSAIFG